MACDGLKPPGEFEAIHRDRTALSALSHQFRHTATRIHQYGKPALSLLFVGVAREHAATLRHDWVHGERKGS